MLGLKTTQNSTFSKIDSKYFSSINQFHSIYIVKSSVAVRFGKTPFDQTTEPHRTADLTELPNQTEKFGRTLFITQFFIL